MYCAWRVGLCLVWLGLLGCAGPASGPRPFPESEAADWAVEGVTLIDAREGVRANQRVVTAGDRIVWVGSMDADGPSARQTIDGRGRFLIPGLWDAHVHFLYEPALTTSMAALFVRYGVTSVRDTGGDLDRLVALREEIRAADAPAPRIFVSGPLLDGEHVVYDGATAEQPPLGVPVAEPASARARVRWLQSRGADFIKIYELVRPEVFAALVEEARALDLPIAAHVPLMSTAEEAGPEVDSMEHLRNLELACAENWGALRAQRRTAIDRAGDTRGFLVRKRLHDAQRLPAIAAYDALRCREVIDSLRDTIQVPTLRLNAFNRSRPDRKAEWASALAGLPDDVRAKFRDKADAYARDASLADTRFADWSLFLVGELHRKAVPIAAGTDTPIRLAIPGESLHRELELLVESGLSPLEAIESATVVPARFFSLEDQMGAIGVGMRADLVLLRADPLLDIRHTREIEGVLSRGHWRASEAR